MTNQELEKIYKESYRAVYWTAMSLLKNEADAEDIVQETFLSLIKSYDMIQDKSKVNSWLKKTAANKCLDRIKLTKTVNVEDEILENIEAVPEDFLPDSIVESEAMRKIVMDIIEKSLSEEVRKTIILFYFDEMSTKEIAEALGIPQGTVLWRLNFARNKIKKEVEKYEEESNTKLFAVPFLTLLFTKEAEQVVIKPMPASLSGLLSASVEAAPVGAGGQVVAETIRKGTGIMIKKLIIWLAALLAVGIIVTVVIVNNNHKKEEKKETSRNARTEITSEEETKENSSAVNESATEESVSEESASESDAAPVKGKTWCSYPHFYINGKEIVAMESTIQDLSDAGCYCVCEGFEPNKVPAETIYYSLDDMPDDMALHSIKVYPDKASADAGVGEIKIRYGWLDADVADGPIPIKNYRILGMLLDTESAPIWGDKLLFDFPLSMTIDQLKENAGDPMNINEDKGSMNYFYYCDEMIQFWCFTFDENGQLICVFMS